MFVRSPGRPQRLGILPGSFNPPTVAHRELVHAAAFHVDEVLCVLPRVFPHKEYFGATLEQRLEMLRQTDLATPHSIAISERGLFLEIARECREHYSPSTELFFLCGTDAAERILNWDYGSPGILDQMLDEFELLVAARGPAFEAPERYRHRIQPLRVDDLHHVSSTEVRARIKAGLAWEDLVPVKIIESVRKIYS